MAKIIKKNRDLEKEYTMHFKKARLAFIFANLISLGFFVGIGLLFTDTPRIICIIMIICSFIGLLFDDIYQKNHTKATILLNGIYGERITKEIIEKLPDDYFGFQNVKVTYNGETSEIDMVVIGPKGIFIIETKHLNGNIKGYAGKTWIQEKIGRGGKVYSNEFYSPVKQVGTHIYRLANYLRDNGANVYVMGAVYFSNPEANVEFWPRENGIAVFSHNHNGKQELTDYILNHKLNINIEPYERTRYLLYKCTLE